MGLNNKTMNIEKLICLKSQQGMEERKIKRDFEMLSARINRYDRLKREAIDLWTEQWFKIKKEYLLDDAQLLKMIKLPEDFDR